MSTNVREAREAAEHVYATIQRIERGGRQAPGFLRHRYRELALAVAEAHEELHDDPVIEAAFHPERDATITQLRDEPHARPTVTAHGLMPESDPVVLALLEEALVADDEARNPSPVYDPELDREPERELLRSQAAGIRSQLRKAYALAKQGEGPRVSAERWEAESAEADRLDDLADQIPTYKSAFRYDQEILASSRRQRRKVTEATWATDAVSFADRFGMHVIDALRELDDGDELLGHQGTVVFDAVRDPVAAHRAAEARLAYRAARVAAAISELGGFGHAARALWDGQALDPDVVAYLTPRMHPSTGRRRTRPRSRRERRRGSGHVTRTELRHADGSPVELVVSSRRHGSSEVGVPWPCTGPVVSVCYSDPERAGWQPEAPAVVEAEPLEAVALPWGVAPMVRGVRDPSLWLRRKRACHVARVAFRIALRDFTLSASDVWIRP